MRYASFLLACLAHQNFGWWAQPAQANMPESPFGHTQLKPLDSASSVFVTNRAAQSLAQVRSERTRKPSSKLAALLASLQAVVAFNPTIRAHSQAGTRLKSREGLRRHGTLQASRRAQVATTNVQAPVANKTSYVTSLTVDNWPLPSNDRLAVVKFFAPWCQQCRRIKPIYEKVAQQFKDKPVDFYEVDFKTEKHITSDANVWTLPTVHIYVGNAGCVDRFSFKYKNKNMLSEKLDRLLASDSLEELMAIKPAVLSPLVRFKEMLGVMQAVMKAPDYLKKDDVKWVSDVQKKEIQELFNVFDRNGDGVIDASEMQAACSALQASTGMEVCAVSPEEMYDMVTAADGDDTTHAIDETAFFRLMAHRARDEIIDKEALLETFKAIDEDGNGTLEVSEFVGLLKRMEKGMSEFDSVFGEVEVESMEELLKAFDLDEAGTFDYTAFVNMVVGRVV